MLEQPQKDSLRRITVRADKTYDTREFFSGTRELNVTTHMQKNEPLEPRCEDHTAPGYAIPSAAAAWSRRFFCADRKN